MGLLSQGSPLSWEETQRHADHVRRHGILQFLHIYHAVKDRQKDVLKWGDEVSSLARGAATCPGLQSHSAPRSLPRAPPRPGVRPVSHALLSGVFLASPPRRRRSRESAVWCCWE